MTSSETEPLPPAESATTESPAATTTPISHRLASGDGRLLISFHWRKDRYDHVIAMVNGAKNESLFRSVNGSADEDWPASPAIQQLSTETIEGKPTILGVGCCGTSHFSVSVQEGTDPNGNQSIRFDWAVRLSKELDEATMATIEGFWLGTTYKPATRRGDGPKKVWRFLCQDNSSFENVREGENTLNRIGPKLVAGERTVQWSYWVTAT